MALRGITEGMFQVRETLRTEAYLSRHKPVEIDL